ncbi:unnamed protein product [Leptidea sinapis]|uniref:Uncharacterized protein n=1 Tax=Leptidea sinapis TaxID=189913 RepID=A0A5E4QEA7_9NEOP|nr:unnamed protein product [Leptidea sinapis]
MRPGYMCSRRLNSLPRFRVAPYVCDVSTRPGYERQRQLRAPGCEAFHVCLSAQAGLFNLAHICTRRKLLLFPILPRSLHRVRGAYSEKPEEVQETVSDVSPPAPRSAGRRGDSARRPGAGV